MPNTLDASGLQVATPAEQTTTLQDGLKGAYGADINLASNSPDGQNVGIFVQAMQDILALLLSVYNSFSPDSAYGVMLHRLVAINGLTLKPGTYTTTPVNVTANQALNLPGLDQALVIPFSVSDPNNSWVLVSSYSFGAAGTQALVFRCATMGPVTPIENTITNQATPTTGITAINNPTTTGTVTGTDEETDPALRIRHAKMFKLAATCPADAIEAALLAIPSVTDAVVLENDTDGVVNTIPAYSIWCIVRGGTAAEIAAAIYAKKAPGAPMKGGVTQVVVRPNGQPATMKWDIEVVYTLKVQFGITPVTAGLTFDNTLLAQQLAAALVDFWSANQTATIGEIVRAMYIIEPRAIITSCVVWHTGSPPAAGAGDTIAPGSSLNYFTLASADITIT